MSLERYRQKRNFAITPEPEGKVGQSRTRELAFVIQKHAATRLHYDFRLELDGVLLSWAVPKGPSLDPNDKRLAMHVEDHPMAYGEFEGVIPAKQYGAGTVMLWDRGIWLPKSDPREAYEKGRLKFELEGEKLHGGWNLVRGSGDRYGGKGWLLFKEADPFARLGVEAAIVDAKPNSVATDRTLEEIKADANRVWHSNKSVASNVEGGAIRKSQGLTGLDKLEGTRQAVLPETILPQLATSTRIPPAGPGWVHEIKFDGYRMLCRVADGKARMISRSGKEWTDEFPGVVRAASRLPVDEAWLDGEVVVMNEQGQISFQALQNAIGAEAPDVLYFAFDLLHLDGFDLRGLPLLERKRLLKKLLDDASGRLRYSEHFAVPGDAFLQNVCGMGLEGMISKRGDLAYQSGRGKAWLKIKCARRQDMVIGGFTDEEGARGRLGALLLGYHEADGALTYAGKVGTGFDENLVRTLRPRLDTLVQEASPFRNPPRGAEGRRAHWVNPVLVASVSFAEWTDEGTLRHPVFQGLRDDKLAKDVRRQSAAEREPEADPKMPAPVVDASAGRNAVAGVALTNVDKVLYAEAAFTKRDLAVYYEAIAEWILPQLRDRPLTLVRCPNGWDKECFYQKNAEVHVAKAIERVKIESDDGEVMLYMMANSRTALISLVQMGALELHPWGSSTPKLGFPDRIILDLDPDEAVAWADVKQAAEIVRTLMDALKLQSFLKTTGGKGLHVVVPIEPTRTWDEIKGFTKAIAELLERTFPDRFTSKLLKVSRRGKIFIDYLRNAEGATAVCAYSTRAKANAPVSTPIAWEELDSDVRHAYFNIVSVTKRMARLKADPWARLSEVKQAITDKVMQEVGYNGKGA